VIAIAIDAAEGRLVRRLAAEGHLPAIARLAGDGRWGTVRSPAALGSGAVWPTFITGEGPDCHGVFGEWAWDPAAMRLKRPSFDHLDPFWRRLADAGARVAVVDVPFAPVVGHARLVEVADWGAHDWLGGTTIVEPASVRESLADLLSVPHPLVAGRVDSDGPGDVEGLRHVVRSLVAGARQRGDLALRLLDVSAPDLLIVVFTEAHRASHLLWHTIDADHPAWREGLPELPADVMSGLVDVFRAIDAQVGRLLARAGPDAAVVLFALHGMQPARGIPALLADLLERWGFASRRRWWQRTAGETLGALVKGAKARLPGPIKAAYYRRVPKSVTLRLAQPSMPVHAWDWSRTRAISLPTDQHGWIRINLAGRESRGIVPQSSYDEVCHHLADKLASLAGPEGPLVRDVVITAEREGGPPARLPDLVVHWAPCTWRARLRVLDPPIDSIPVGLKFVAQHADDGFFVGRGTGVDDWPAVVEASDLGRRLGRAAGVLDA
jgi:predicted AlkP superfamily phosphohydrolase/phosphomutase